MYSVQFLYVSPFITLMSFSHGIEGLLVLMSEFGFGLGLGLGPGRKSGFGLGLGLGFGLGLGLASPCRASPK